MNVDLTPYAGKKICIAVSGGRDSMALLHYFHANCRKAFIMLSALNCDHCMRGGESAADSAFVAEYCAKNGIPLTFFKAEGLDLKGEQQAREWRLSCYDKALEGGVDYVATAHHMNDNAETVLFNLARGASLSGLTGITDDLNRRIVRPLIGCTREEIDFYLEQNGIPFVTDSTNLSLDYTRNKIRGCVLPALEEAVHGACRAIYRFSRLAAEDEEYFMRLAEGLIVRRFNGSYLIKACTEPVIFKRVIARILKENYIKDYTAAQLRTVYEMQWLGNGKRFEFLGLTAVKEDNGIAIFKDGGLRVFGGFCMTDGGDFKIVRGREKAGAGEKALFFDADAIPEGAVIRTRMEGDRFTKFGGGSGSLSDYFTNKKVPQSLRNFIPLVCKDGEVFIVGGVEISDKIKLTENTKSVATFICADILNN